MANIPTSRPQISREDLLKGINIDFNKYPLFVVGVRGYYKDTMGVKGKNDIGIFDDALFIVSPNVFASFNGNCDPQSLKTGRATLKPGTYYAHNFGLHKDKYLALVQRMGMVTVMRHLQGEETGYFGINIHAAGINETLSEGCQTIYKPQYEAFITLGSMEAKRLYGKKWDKTIIPYALLEQQ